jgi:hypothetical protein
MFIRCLLLNELGEISLIRDFIDLESLKTKSGQEIIMLASRLYIMSLSKIKI